MIRPKVEEMIEKYGYKLGIYLWKKGYIDSEEDVDYFRFALVALSSDILNTIGILSIALISHRLIDMLVYLIGFHLLRSNAGGYHANSLIACFGITVVAFILALWYSTLNLIWTTIGFLLISVMLFFKNLPYFTKEQWQYPLIHKLHLRCKVVSTLLLIVSGFFYFLGDISYFHIIGFLMMEVALSMVYGRFRYESD